MVISWIAVVSRPHPEHRKVGLVRTSTMSTRERWPASIGSTRSPRFTAYPSHPTSRLVQSARGKVLPPPLGSVLSAPAQEYRWGTLPSTYPATPVLPDEPKICTCIKRRVNVNEIYFTGKLRQKRRQHVLLVAPN